MGCCKISCFAAIHFLLLNSCFLNSCFLNQHVWVYIEFPSLLFLPFCEKEELSFRHFNIDPYQLFLLYKL